jgi:hypothetical protein
MKYSLFATLAVAVFVIGCEVPELESPQAAAPAQSGQPAPTEVPTEGSRLEQAAHVDPEAFLPDGRVDMSGVKGEPPMTSGIPREVHPKDPKQGKLSRRAGGTLGTTMQSMPWVKNETTFNLVIKPALLQYEIIHSHYPRSHQEFMEEFIPEMCPQVLPLPELEPGDEYIYDPEDHLLKIWRPAEATPEMRAKMLGEPAPATDQTAPADDAAQPADAAAPGASYDPSIRGRAEALQGQVNQGAEALPPR